MKSKIGVWDKDTVIRLAGPLTYIAEEEQVFDQMFGARNAPAQAMLGKFGYLEGIQTNAYRIRKKAEIPRHIRAESGFKDPAHQPRRRRQATRCVRRPHRRDQNHPHRQPHRGNRGQGRVHQMDVK